MHPPEMHPHSRALERSMERVTKRTRPVMDQQHEESRKRPRPSKIVPGKRKRDASDSDEAEELDLKRLAISPRVPECADASGEPCEPSLYSKVNMELKDCHFQRQRRILKQRHEAARAEADLPRHNAPPKMTDHNRN